MKDNKPPKSATSYYVKLFCKKNKYSKDSIGVRKALKSWWSLSAAEQQPFVDKFNLIQEKHKENCINYLKSVEPFMKKKKIREENSGHCVSEPEITHEENHLQPVLDTSRDINESISSKEPDPKNQDPDANTPASSHEIIDATEEISKIPEPTPPCTKQDKTIHLLALMQDTRIQDQTLNGRELFEMVTNAMGGSNLEWKYLSKVEKYKYRNAVLSIKREYIKEYQNYLERLPSIELFQHYIKTMEKYKLFY